MEKIISIKNSKVKDWVKLRTTHGRRKLQSYLLEGKHPVEEALQAGITYQYLIVEEGRFEPDFLQNIPDERLILISSEVSTHISDTVTNQGIFMVCPMPTDEQTMPESIAGKWLLLDHIQDPGNIGTMVRTADAAGYAGVVFGSGTADMYNPKILRAMQGSQYHLVIKKLNLLDWITKSNANKYPVFGTLLDKQAVSYRDVQPVENFALIMGNEGNGMDAKLSQKTDSNLYIPIKGQAESLNVAIAAGVLMFALV